MGSMDLLAITRHAGLAGALRAALEPAGYGVEVLADPLQALAGEAWDRARLVLVDAEGDPMDGYRLCHLLRGESRPLFQTLPVFLVLDRAPGPDDQARLAAAGGEGFIQADAAPHRLLATLGPLLAGTGDRPGGAPAPVLALGLSPVQAARLGQGVAPCGCRLHRSQPASLAGDLDRLRPPLLFLGVSQDGEAALAALGQIQPPFPYPILVGGRASDPVLRRLFQAGAQDWIPSSLAAPVLLQACRRALAWTFQQRLRGECRRQLGDLFERRRRLAEEAALLRSEALTDPLTDLLNRRAFTQHLEHAGHQWERHRRAFVLIMGDLDYFKLINDRFGHLAGDQVLTAVGSRIRASLRRSDLPFRIGGEEFAILLLETSLKAGLEVAEKIRRRIEEAPVVLASGPVVFPTMSFGVGTPDGLEVTDLVARVDEALYRAKHMGRNRVESLGG